MLRQVIIVSTAVIQISVKSTTDKRIKLEIKLKFNINLVVLTNHMCVPSQPDTLAITRQCYVYSADNQRNACHGSDSEQSASREIEFFFPSKGPKRQSTATFTDCTLCVIKPHAVLAGLYVWVTDVGIHLLL